MARPTADPNDVDPVLKDDAVHTQADEEFKQQLAIATRRKKMMEQALRELLHAENTLENVTKYKVIEKNLKNLKNEWGFDGHGVKMCGIIDAKKQKRQRIIDEILGEEDFKDYILSIRDPYTQSSILLEYFRFEFLSTAERSVFEMIRPEYVAETGIPVVLWKKIVAYVVVLCMLALQLAYVFVFGVSVGNKAASNWLIQQSFTMMTDFLLIIPLFVSLRNVILPLYTMFKVHKRLIDEFNLEKLKFFGPEESFRTGVALRFAEKNPDLMGSKIINSITNPSATLFQPSKETWYQEKMKYINDVITGKKRDVFTCLMFFVFGLVLAFTAILTAPPPVPDIALEIIITFLVFIFISLWWLVLILVVFVVAVIVVQQCTKKPEEVTNEEDFGGVNPVVNGIDDDDAQRTYEEYQAIVLEKELNDKKAEKQRLQDAIAKAKKEMKDVEHALSDLGVTDIKESENDATSVAMDEASQASQKSQKS